jgi:hypothetical protein
MTSEQNLPLSPANPKQKDLENLAKTPLNPLARLNLACMMTVNRAHDPVHVNPHKNNEWEIRL